MLWRRQRGGELTHEAYDALGGVRGALRAHIDEEWQQYTRADGYDEAAAQSLLTKLVRVPIGAAAAIRRTATRTELTADEWRIAQDLAATRLLVTGRSPERVETVELAHEALISAWGDLAAWVATDRAFLEWRESLRHDLARWEHADRTPDLLPGPATLAGAQGRERELGEAEREYVRQGRARHRSRIRRRRALTAVLAVLALIAAGIGAVSVREQQEASQKAAVIRSTTLAADSQSVGADDPGLAAQLAVAAYRSSPTQDATTALYTALEAPLLDNVLATTRSMPLRTAAQADGPLGAAVEQSGTIHVWNLANPAKPVPESTFHTFGGIGIALAPRAPLLAGGCVTGGLCLWTLTDAARPAVVAHLPIPAAVKRTRISSMAISPDGRLLAAASEDGFGLLWSIAQPDHPLLLADLPDPTSQPDSIASVAFAPDSSLLAESVEHGSTRLWSLSNPAAPRQTAKLAHGYQDLAVTPAGVLAGASDTSLDLWDIRNPRSPGPISYDGSDTSDSEDLEAVSVSPDGGSLAFSGTDVDTGNSVVCLLGLTTLADAAAGDGATCQSTGFSTFAMAYTSSGALLTGGYDSTVRLWRDSPALVANAAVLEADADPSISPDGRFMVAEVADADMQTTSTMGIWDLSAPSGPSLDATLPMTATAEVATFLSADVVLTVAQNGQVQVWNVSVPHHPRWTASLGTVGSEVYPQDGAGSNSTGDEVSVLGNGGVLRLWHVAATGAASPLGSLTDRADTGPGGIIAQGSTAFMTTSKGIDWWDITDPAHPVKTGFSALAQAGRGEGASDNTSSFAAATPLDPDDGVSVVDFYNLRAGRVLSAATISNHSGTVLGLSDSGALLASGGLAGNGLGLWDTADARAPKLDSTLITAFDITGVTFSDDARMMADWDAQTVQLWDIRNPRSPVLMGTFSPVTDVENTLQSELVLGAGYLLGGKLVISVQSTGPSLVYVLDAQPLQAADQICSFVTSPITAAQWRQYAPGVPYHAPCARPPE